MSVQANLEPYLPVPTVEKSGDGFRWNFDNPKSVGKVHSFYGAFLIAVRAYTYIRSLGKEGLRSASENALINANYIRARLADYYDVAYNAPICMHEAVFSASRQKREGDVRALDISKRLMDYGFHPPTNYFPLIVPEALMIEPTETESKQTIDTFIEAMISIAKEAKETPEIVRTAPHTTLVSRLDETMAVKSLDLRYEPLFR